MKKSPKIVITAGPTIEPIDPVRFISNYSTGTMGYAIAEASSFRGYEVCLITGPCRQEPPKGITVIRVTKASEMLRAVEDNIIGARALIMSAAVCDFTPVRQAETKIKKCDHFTLELTKNPDILCEVGTRNDLVKIGFALETDNAIDNGWDKLERKELDLIVVNTTEGGNDPFGSGRKDFFILDPALRKKEVKGVTKPEMAGVIIDQMQRMIDGKEFDE